MFKKLLILILILLISGCNYNEISNLTILENISIDKQNKQFIINATTNSSIENEKQLITSKGYNINKTINNLNSDKSKKLYFNHLKSVIISNLLNENDIKIILNFFIKNNSKINIYFTNNKAIDIINYIKTNNITMINDNSNSFEKFHNNYLNNKYFITSNIDIKDNNLNYDTLTIYKNNKQIKNINSDIYHLLTNDIVNFDLIYNNSLISISNINFLNNKLDASYIVYNDDYHITSNDIINYLNKELEYLYSFLLDNNIKTNKNYFNKLKEIKYE